MGCLIAPLRPDARGPKQKKRRVSAPYNSTSPARKAKQPSGLFRSAAEGRSYRGPKQKKRRVSAQNKKTSPARKSNTPVGCLIAPLRPNARGPKRKTAGEADNRTTQARRVIGRVWSIVLILSVSAALTLREEITSVRSCWEFEPESACRLLSPGRSPWMTKSAAVLPGEIANCSINGYSPVRPVGVYGNPLSSRIISHRKRWNSAILKNQPRSSSRENNIRIIHSQQTPTKNREIIHQRPVHARFPTPVVDVVELNIDTAVP